MMLKRKWSPLSTQTRIAEAINASHTGMSLVDLQCCDYLAGASAHSIAVCLRLMAKRGFVADHPISGTRIFILTDRGKRDLDLQRMARARLAQRLRMEIPLGTYPEPAPSSTSPQTAILVSLQAAEDTEKVPTHTAVISRAHLRRIVNRALANQAPLTEDDRTALAAAIKEAA